jgi:hypothetical protein
MRSIRLQLVVLVLSLLSSWQNACQAQIQSPSFLKRMFQPKGSGEVVELQDKHGPWLILAQTFPGEEGRNHAIVYAKELQANLRAPVFTMERNSDTEGVLGRSERKLTDKNGRIQSKTVAAKFVNGGPGLSYAVLVGEFHTKEDPQINKLLKQIRQYQPKAKLPGFERGAAFLTRNPLLPDDYFQAPAVDSFTEELNRQDWIKRGQSLLDCPGRFTVRVASFRGPEVISASAKVKLKTDEPTNALDKAASKAHKLTESLRSRGVEAYEFHDRFGSYVTIGNFNDLGRDIDGQFQYDPRIVAILNQYCGYEIVKARDKATQAEMQTMSVKTEVIKSKDGGRTLIPFDIEGKPIAVPKVQSSKIYGGSVFK